MDSHKWFLFSGTVYFAPLWVASWSMSTKEAKDHIPSPLPSLSKGVLDNRNLVFHFSLIFAETKPHPCFESIAIVLVA